ncbi:MAG: PEP-CTERM sorting domain-containing protein [Phycisphaerae bacterium]|jgi:hypothetical protein
MKRGLLLIGLLLAAWPATASAVILFSDDFDADHTANWTVNRSHDNTAAPSDADFFFDYSTVGIPSANGLGGTTRGLRMRANRPGGSASAFSGISVSPTGGSFTGDYKITFDAWMNYQGSTTNGVFDGGSGTTQALNFGLGTAGTSAQWAGAAVKDSVFFAATFDGNSSVDYRAYSSAATSGYLAASGVFAAGTGTSPDARNDTHSYYQGLGSKSPPAAQNALYPSTQHGTTRPGSAGFAWRKMVVEKKGNIATWTLDNLLIATVDLNTVTLAGDNILFGVFDTNATPSADGALADELLFGLIDNVVVTPEPASLMLLAGGALLLRGRRRR